MSFFGQKGDENNLQYDDTAFLYFIASFVSLGAVVSLVLILRDLWSLSIKHKEKLAKNHIFKTKISNLQGQRKRQIFGKGFFVKLAVFVILGFLLKVISNIASQNQNKLKGFDPFEILGVPKDASLRDIKKAYRKLALEFHPDKNIGNAQAQNKFILISKSYQCFTDQSKKANCFKYGNPDGIGSFRVGIGLPQFFINTEYKYYVLPIVLGIFLVLIPWLMISWNNKTKVLDHDGISISSYNTFFQCFSNTDQPVDKYTFLYIITSFPELYEDENCRPITSQDKLQLQRLLNAIPVARKSVINSLNDNQLDLLLQLYRYCAKLADFRSQGLRKNIEYFIGKTANMILMFASKPKVQGEEIGLFGNPDWKIRYLGYKIIQNYLQFQRDYYNRTLLIPRNNFLWIHNLDLDPPSKVSIIQAISTNRITTNLFEIITSPEKTQALCQLVAPQSQKNLELQLKELPIYDINLKIKVGDKEKNVISNVDYATIYYRVKRRNDTSGYSLVNNYPYPKKDSIYLLALQDKDLLFMHKVDFPLKQDEFVQKFQYRSGRLGNHVISMYAIHQAIFQIDTYTVLPFNVVEMPKEVLERPIQFHPEDIHLEKLYKNFFQTLIELEVDPEENQLSDSEDEEEIQKAKRNQTKNKKEHSHEDCNQCSDDQESDGQNLD